MVQRADIRVDARVTDPATTEGPADSIRRDASDPAGSADPNDTAVFMLPQATTPRAVLDVTDPDGRTRVVEIGAGGLTIGRAEDNDLVARDGRVSRHHGRIVGRRGTLIYLDLGSTNGSKVNGEPVREVVLGVGDRLEVGDTTLVLEVAEGPD
jgi:pSer/pThr/pTyr-binding forkhead associated (FHA) protein